MVNHPLRGLFKDVIIYGLSDGIGKGLTFFSLLFYARFLAPPDNGALSILTTGISLLFAVMSIDGEITYMRFALNTRSLEERQVVTSTWLIFLGLWTGGTAVVLLLAARPLSTFLFADTLYYIPVVLMILNVPLLVINRVCGQVLRNQSRVVTFAAINLFTLLLMVVLSLYLGAGLKLGLVGILAGNVLAGLLMLPVRLWTVRDLIRLRFSPTVLSEMIRFGWPLVLTEFGYWIFVSSDRFLLGKLGTLEQVGFYGLANTIVSIMLGAHAALAQAWPLYATRAYDEKAEGASEKFGQVATYIMAGLGLLCVGITAFAPELLIIVTHPAYYPAAQAVAPLCLAALAYTSTHVTSLSITLTKRTQFFVLISWCAAVINLVLNLIFIPSFGMMAASWSSTATYTLVTIAYFLVSQRLWPIHYEWSRIASLLLLTIGFTVLAPMLPSYNLSAGLALKAVYCLLYIGCLWALGIFNQRELTLLRAFIKRRKMQTAEH